MVDTFNIRIALIGTKTATEQIVLPCSPISAFKADRLYLWTPEGLFQSDFRSCHAFYAACEERLVDHYFVCVHDGVLVNARFLREINYRERMVGIDVGRSARPEIGWVIASRRGWQNVHRWLLLPPPTRPVTNHMRIGGAP